MAASDAVGHRARYSVFVNALHSAGFDRIAGPLDQRYLGLDDTESEPQQDTNEPPHEPPDEFAIYRDIDFDDGYVQREREWLLEHQEKAHKNVHEQTRIMERINEQLVQFDDYVPDEDQNFFHRPDARGSFVDKGNIADAAHAHNFTEALLASITTLPSVAGSLGKSSHTMSQNILRRDSRQAQFNRRRKEVLDQRALEREKVAARMHDAEERAAEKLRNQSSENRRKIYLKQQREAAQQKFVKDMQRAKERDWERYYAEMHHVSDDKHSHGSTAPRRSVSDRTLPALAKPTEQVPPHIANEPIFRKTLQSHNLYTSRMESWRQFVTENEQRTRAFWQKMLGPNYQEYVDQLRGLPPVTRTRRGSVREVKSVLRTRGKWQRTSSVGNLDDGSDESPETRAVLSAEVIASPSSIKNSRSRDALSETTSTTNAQNHLSSPTSPSWKHGWAERKEAVDAHLAEQHLQRTQTWQSISSSVEDARQRKLNLDRKIKRAATLRAEEWDARQKATARMKDESIERNGQELISKLQRSQERRDEESRRLQEERNRRAAQRDANIREGIAANEERREKEREATEAALQRKDSQTAKHFETLHREFENRVGQRDYDGKVAERLEQKRQLDAEFRAKAKDEIEGKLLRSTAVLERKSQSALKRSASRRRTGSMPSSPAGTASGIDAVLETSASIGFGSTPLGHESFGKASRSSIDSRISDSIATTSGAHHYASGDTEHDESEREFIKELEERSSKWLKDMRQKMSL